MLRTPTRNPQHKRRPDRLDRFVPALDRHSYDQHLSDLLETISRRSFFYPDPVLQDRHILSIADLDKTTILHVLQQAGEYRQRLAAGERLNVMDGQILATLFYEPSTRTRLSFEAAMHRLGGQVISTPDGGVSSSAAKGESIADSIRTVCGYADVIVQRHPAIGSAQAAAIAANGAGIPVINAGDGAGEHPTQALLDLYTMRDERGTLDGLHVVLAGDLKHGRTVHSLVQALCQWKVQITLVAPPALAMPRELITGLDRCQCIRETDDLRAAVKDADVLYMTRIQKERFADPSDYEALKGQFVVDRSWLCAHPDLTLMHPLPRVDEIAPDADDHPHAAYFRQAHNGLFVRMALLALVKGRAIGP